MWPVLLLHLLYGWCRRLTGGTDVRPTGRLDGNGLRLVATI